MIFAFLLPFIAVFIGAGIAFYFKPKTPKGMKLILAFSGSFLLSILILEMLPQVYEAGTKTTGFWILGGILFQILLEFLSKGAEHGHTHHHSTKFPWLILISLCIHAFLEGMPLGLQPALLWGVSVHKIPIGLVIGALLLQSNATTLLKVVALCLFALMSPLGSYVTSFTDTQFTHSVVEPFVVGILFHISTTILFESTEGHNFNLQKFLTILLGIGMAAIF
ncbi:MAG: ZIP family metal transporter [Candidatus Arcticimaribacter sp.]